LIILKGNVVFFVVIVLKKRLGVFFAIRRVGADAPPAFDRITGAVLAAALHDSDFTKENILEFSRNFRDHLDRKPLRQLHWIEVFMITTNMELLGITPQDLEQVPAD
jgi:hypothetical protein